MKELSDFNDELNGGVHGNTTLSIPTINFRNAMKYLILFISVTTATMVIPSCGVLRRHGVYVD
jgi:hypothetical protein